MAQFHFVEDYERHVDQLLLHFPIDEAMSLAVGGGYDHVGAIEVELLQSIGLRAGMSLLDLGCGSGRLPHALAQRIPNIEYTGIDIVQKLLDYASTKTPQNYRFILHRELSIPLSNETQDMISAFSLFTHLLHTETYIYLEEVRRVLKPGGSILFSFLEFSTPEHWPAFSSTVDASRKSQLPHLNMFIERNAIQIWAAKLGLECQAFIDSNAVAGKTGPLGQSCAILRKT